jgi:hypothetical protein
MNDILLLGRMKTPMKSNLFPIRMMGAMAVVLLSSCATCVRKTANHTHGGGAEVSPLGLIKSVDHRPGKWENHYRSASVWKRVKDDPAVFHPKCLPKGFPITPKTGTWVVDPQDGAAFFVPYKDCGGFSSSVWLAEAKKAVNLHNKEGQSSRNMATVMIVWPLYITASAIVGAGAAMH